MKFFYGFEFEFLYNDKDSVLIKDLQDALKIKVRGSGIEYPEFKPTNTEFKIKTDVSGGPKMRELITGVLSKDEASDVLIKMLNWINSNAKLNDKCSLHINISCDNPNFKSLNETIFRARLDEDRIFEMFPERKNNAYCRSVKNFFAKDLSIVTELTKNFIPIFLFPNSKYYGVNFKKRELGYLEFRYIGGSKYAKKFAEIVEAMTIFENTIQSTLEKDVLKNDAKTILKLVKQQSKITAAYNNFEAFEDLNVQLSIDLRISQQLLKTFYPNIRDKVFSLIAGMKKTNDKTVIINYDSDYSKLQINEFEGYLEFVSDVEIINSKLIQSDIYYCDTYNSTINSSIINNCNLFSGTSVISSKCENSYLNSEAKIEKTFFGGVSGVLNGVAKDSIVYNCKVGELAEIDDKCLDFKTTKIKSGFFVVGDDVIIKQKTNK